MTGRRGNHTSFPISSICNPKHTHRLNVCGRNTAICRLNMRSKWRQARRWQVDENMRETRKGRVECVYCEPTRFTGGSQTHLVEFRGLGGLYLRRGIVGCVRCRRSYLSCRCCIRSNRICCCIIQCSSAIPTHREFG